MYMQSRIQSSYLTTPEYINPKLPRGKPENSDWSAAPTFHIHLRWTRVSTLFMHTSSCWGKRWHKWGKWKRIWLNCIRLFIRICSYLRKIPFFFIYPWLMYFQIIGPWPSEWCSTLLITWQQIATRASYRRWWRLRWIHCWTKLLKQDWICDLEILICILRTLKLTLFLFKMLFMKLIRSFISCSSMSLLC